MNCHCPFFSVMFWIFKQDLVSNQKKNRTHKIEPISHKKNADVCISKIFKTSRIIRVWLLNSDRFKILSEKKHFDGDLNRHNLLLNDFFRDQIRGSCQPMFPIKNIMLDRVLLQIKVNAWNKALYQYRNSIQNIKTLKIT